MLGYASNISDLAILFSRLTASLSTLLTMFVVVLFAFAGADFTDFNTGIHDLRNEAGAATHIGSSGPTYVSTVNAEAGTLGHAAQAFISAVFTLISAVNGNIDTRLSYFVSHGNSPYKT